MAKKEEKEKKQAYKKPVLKKFKLIKKIRANTAFI